MFCLHENATVTMPQGFDVVASLFDKVPCEHLFSQKIALLYKKSSDKLTGIVARA